MKLLFINACVRDKESRTLSLANHFISKYKENNKDVEIKELVLNNEKINPLLNTSLKERDKLIRNKEYQDKMFSYAREFAASDKIVIAAPCWDYSFPSILKVYIENICVLGMTFKYNTKGNTSTGLSKFSSLLYITTVGGYPCDKTYIKNIAAFLGKGKYFDVYAKGLDILGNDINKILDKAKKQLDRISKIF